jgi:hypothetical protein
LACQSVTLACPHFCPCNFCVLDNDGVGRVTGVVCQRAITLNIITLDEANGNLSPTHHADSISRPHLSISQPHRSHVPPAHMA